jgi:hypothetical protein
MNNKEGYLMNRKAVKLVLFITYFCFFFSMLSTKLWPDLRAEHQGAVVAGDILIVLSIIFLWISMILDCVHRIFPKKYIKNLWLFFLVFGSWAVIPFYFFKVYKVADTNK